MPAENATTHANGAKRKVSPGEYGLYSILYIYLFIAFNLI